jgi:hypothetical protein
VENFDFVLNNDTIIINVKLIISMNNKIRNNFFFKIMMRNMLINVQINNLFIRSLNNTLKGKNTYSLCKKEINEKYNEFLKRKKLKTLKFYF